MESVFFRHLAPVCVNAKSESGALVSSIECQPEGGPDISRCAGILLALRNVGRAEQDRSVKGVRGEVSAPKA